MPYCGSARGEWIVTLGPLRHEALEWSWIVAGGPSRRCSNFAAAAGAMMARHLLVHRVLDLVFFEQYLSTLRAATYLRYCLELDRGGAVE